MDFKNKTPLFKINQTYLYKEQRLVILDVDILFTCIDETGQRYLVLHYDEDDYWIKNFFFIVPISLFTLINMLNGDISINSAFTSSILENHNCGYSICTKNLNTDENTLNYFNLTTAREQALPLKEVYYPDCYFSSDKTKIYIELLKKELETTNRS